MYPSTSPRKERIPLTSFHPGLRDPSPQKPANPPSRRASERRKHQRQKRPVTRMAKNYHLPRPSHHLQKSEARGSRFFHITCMTSYLSVKRYPSPIATLQTSLKKIDIKNQPSGKHLRYLFIRHNLPVMPDGCALRKQPNRGEETLDRASPPLPAKRQNQQTSPTAGHQKAAPLTSSQV